jgi:hypothetical protein
MARRRYRWPTLRLVDDIWAVTRLRRQVETYFRVRREILEAISWHLDRDKKLTIMGIAAYLQCGELAIRETLIRSPDLSRMIAMHQKIWSSKRARLYAQRLGHLQVPKAKHTEALTEAA